MHKAKLTLAVTLTRCGALVPYEGNARRHSEAQVAEIEASIRAFGYTNPVLEDGGRLVAGHGRLAAVLAMYARDEVVCLPNGEALPKGVIPSISCTGWSEVKRRAYILADNKIAANAEWDDGLLRMELQYLETEEFDLSLSGFTDAEFAKLLAEGATTDAMAEWTGMPEFHQPEVASFRSIMVHFADQQGVDEFCELLQRKLTEKTKFLWFPEMAAATFADKRYVSTEGEGTAAVQAEAST